MDQPTFTEFVNQERERLNNDRAKIDEQIAALSEQRAGIDRELSAIRAYEVAKAGTTTRQGQGRGRRNLPAPRAARHGSRRESLLNLIQTNPGLSRGQILEKMGLKGNKSGEMSVSNALTALTKGHQVRRDSGKYLPAA